MVRPLFFVEAGHLPLIVVILLSTPDCSGQIFPADCGSHLATPVQLLVMSNMDPILWWSLPETPDCGEACQQPMTVVKPANNPWLWWSLPTTPDWGEACQLPLTVLRPANSPWRGDAGRPSVDSVDPLWWFRPTTPDCQAKHKALLFRQERWVGPPLSFFTVRTAWKNSAWIPQLFQLEALSY